MKLSLVLLSFMSILFSNIQVSVQLFELKCLVCREVVKEITEAVLSEDPKKTIQVGSFRIQPDGTQKKSQIKYAGSEIHLNDVLENICDNMENFAQAKHKQTGEMALLNLSKDVEKLDVYELVPDPDLNRGLKYYCESFIEDTEDDIISAYKKVPENAEITKKLCSEVAGYCSSYPYHMEL